MDSTDQFNGPPSLPSPAVRPPPPPSADAAGMDPLFMDSAGNLNGPPPPLLTAMPRPLPSLAGTAVPPPSLSAVPAAAVGVTAASLIPGPQVAILTRGVGATTAVEPHTLDASAGTAVPLPLPSVAPTAAAGATAAALNPGPQVAIPTRGPARAVVPHTLDATAAAVPEGAAPGAVPAAAMSSPVAVVGDKGGVGGGVPVDDVTVKQWPPQEEHVVVIGDPGAGKSTLLNTLCGGAVEFPSGLSIGTGLTTTVQSVIVKGTRFTDTPGLDDPSMKEQAAQAIADAIRFGGAVKLLFVFTLESGRIRSSALVTVRVVLNALHEAQVDVGKRFTVLLNKLSSDEWASWAAAKEATGADMSVDERMKGGKTTVCSWTGGQLLFVPNEDGLVDAANGMLSAASASLLTAHIVDAPAVHIRPGTAVTIRTDQLEAAAKEAEEKLAALDEAQRAELGTIEATLRRKNEEHVASAKRNGRGAGGSAVVVADMSKAVVELGRSLKAILEFMCQVLPARDAPRG